MSSESIIVRRRRSTAIVSSTGVRFTPHDRAVLIHESLVIGREHYLTTVFYARAFLRRLALGLNSWRCSGRAMKKSFHNASFGSVVQGAV